MKKSIFIAAVAALALGMTACTDDPIVIDNPEVIGGETTTHTIKTTSDLIGTEWSYSIDEGNLLDVYMIDDVVISMPEVSFGLTFDASHAHFSFPESAEAYALAEDGITMEQIGGIDYEYSYDGETHIGHLIGTVLDEEGNLVDASLEFSYDEEADTITFALPIYSFENEEYTTGITFTRVNK